MLKKNKNRNKKYRHGKIQVFEMLNYFDDNNIGYTDGNFALNQAYYKIRLVFDKHYFRPKQNTMFSYIKLFEDLLLLKKDLQMLYKNHLITEKDYRTGVETYGYDSWDKITSDLSYVCDRWNCAFRIRWLIDLLEFYEQNQLEIYLKDIK